MFYEREYRLTPFRAEGPEVDLRFVFERTEELQPPEGKLVSSTDGVMIYAEDNHWVRYLNVQREDWKTAWIRVVPRETGALVQMRKESFPSKIPVKCVLECLEAEHIIARNNGFIFHCSYIDHDGNAILFTAPSETGKSTQADLWNRYRGAEIVNGDRAAVRLANGVLMAEGIPFAGSSEHCKNRSLPIEAIVYLGQAPQTSIRKMWGYEAFFRIWEGVSVNTWDREDLERVSAVVQKAAAEIPVYHLPCTPDESAVIALENALRKQVKQ